MKRLLAAAGIGLVPMLTMTLLPPGVAVAGTATKVTLFPVGDGNQLETHTWVECNLPITTCNFTAGVQLRTPDGVEGFGDKLWARQSTEVRSSNRSAYLDVHADGGPETKVFKEGGNAVITTIYQGAGPPEKYQTNGLIDVNEWATGQPKTDANVIVCAHVQVVYPGVNLTTPATCAIAKFS
ncbi:MAG TPA: hypothetical protein VF299_05475 [Mycobacterium sp.]